MKLLRLTEWVDLQQVADFMLAHQDRFKNTAWMRVLVVGKKWGVAIVKLDRREYEQTSKRSEE